MNKNVKAILAAMAMTLATGCVMAGTWVNGNYIDGPICTVCDGMKVITHAYGTTLCAHCDGTGIEPPEETVVVENVIVDIWCPPPPQWHRHRPAPPHHVRPRHGHNGVRPVGGTRPPQRKARAPAQRTAAPRAAARPAARTGTPRGGGVRGGGARSHRR